MKPLAPPDSFHLQAAEGWIGLGNFIEANEELERIAPGLRAHPEVLELRWRIYANANKWDAALDIAAALTKRTAEWPLAWVHYAVALHKLKRTQEARQALLPILAKCPENGPMHYDMACYECQVGNMEEARRLLEKAFALGPAKELKLLALEDPDLEPLWNKIGKL